MLSLAKLIEISTTNTQPKPDADTKTKPPAKSSDRRIKDAYHYLPIKKLEKIEHSKTRKAPIGPYQNSKNPQKTPQATITPHSFGFCFYRKLFSIVFV
jgi:hypothetical protein